MEYIYPKFGAVYYFDFVRIGGCGLANCLYTYAHAISIAHKTGARIITPCWFNLSIGTYIRHQADKRHYLGLMSCNNEIAGINKLLKLLFCKNNMTTVSGLGNYFLDCIDDAEYVSSYIIDHIQPKHKLSVEKFDFDNAVAIHVRLGDYNEQTRIPLSWYIEKVKQLKTEGYRRFLLFSDGTDKELKELSSVEGVERVFFGSSISDIYAMSKCSYLVGSDSTFSGWAAFLGQVPCVFKRKHYGRVLLDSSKEIVEEQ